MSRTIAKPIPLADSTSIDATQVAAQLARTLLSSSSRLAKHCSCTEGLSSDACRIETENDRVHLEFDPRRRCPKCGEAPAST